MMGLGQEGYTSGVEPRSCSGPLQSSAVHTEVNQGMVRCAKAVVSHDEVEPTLTKPLQSIGESLFFSSGFC
jgi:hypothetical protein